MESEALAPLREFHVWLGFATAFVAAPIALVAKPGSRLHRRAGKLYVAGMCVLFASGMMFTFSKHELLSYKWARNVAFNALGFALLFPGLRALKLHALSNRFAARPLDWAVTALLGALSAATLAMGARKWPLLWLGAAGAALCWLDVRELRGRARGGPPRALDRHARYMLASYFYVLTVVSLVYGPAGAEAKWLWPLALALPTLVLSSPSARRGARIALSQRGAARFTAAVGVLTALLVALEVARTGVLVPSSQDGATPRTPAIAAAP